MKKSGKIMLMLTIVPLCFSLKGCSVKEDRWKCPCEIVFRPGEGVSLDRGGGFALSVFESAYRESVFELLWRQVMTGDYSCSVSRGDKRMSIVSGLGLSYLRDNEWRIIEGNQADSLYASTLDVNCRGDEAIVPLSPNKQFSTVFLTVDGASDTYPLSLEVKGEICGLNLSDMTPLPGDFHYVLTALEGETGEYRFRLPRQLPDDKTNLVLELRESAGESGAPSLHLPLGEMIIASGHDWTRESLEDIHVIIGNVELGIQVAINDWITVWECNYVI